MSGGLVSVFVVAVNKDQKIILLEQERYPVGRDVIELPAGGMVPGGDPLAMAEQELHEEANSKAEKVKLLGELLVAPGRQVVTLYVVLSTWVNVEGFSVDYQEGNRSIIRVWAVAPA